MPEPRRTPTLAEVESVADELDRRRFRSEAAALRLSFELWRARHRAGERATTRVRVPRSASMDVRLLAYEVRAARAVAAGRDGEARRHAAAGLDALGEWQRTFGSLDLQTSVVMHGNGLILTGPRVRPCARAGRTCSSNGRSARATSASRSSRCVHRPTQSSPQSWLSCGCCAPTA